MAVTEEKRMRRVLMLGPLPPPFGGIASLMQAIIGSNLAHDYSFEIFVRESIMPGKWSGLISRTLFRVKRFARFFIVLRKTRYDFVHMHVAFNRSFLGTAVFMLIAKITRTKVLLHIHGTDWGMRYKQVNPGLKLVYLIGVRMADRIVVLFDAWNANIRKLAPRTPVHTLHNFLEDVETRVPHQCSSLRAQIGAGEDCLLVLTVGFVGWRKGHLDILDALPRIVEANERVRFVMVGGEEFPGESLPVIRKIEEKGLGKYVSVIKEVDRDIIQKYLLEADIFLLPSRREGMPMSILEAMRAGCTIVSSTVGGIPDMIQHGKSGLLVKPGSPADIADAIEHLIKNQTLRRELGKGARKAFEERFEQNVGVSKLAEIYDLMCHSP